MDRPGVAETATGLQSMGLQLLVVLGRVGIIEGT